MPYELIFDEANRLLFARVYGDDSVEDQLERMRKCVEDPRWRPGYRVLTDLREVTSASHRYEHLERITGFHSKHMPSIGPTKVAAVVKDDLLYGIRRMMDSFSEGHTELISSVFKSWPEALQWLGLPSTYEPPEPSVPEEKNP